MVREFCVDSHKVKLEVVREYQRLQVMEKERRRIDKRLFEAGLWRSTVPQLLGTFEFPRGRLQLGCRMKKCDVVSVDEQLEIPSCDVVTCGAPSFSSEHPTPTCLYAAERTAAHRALRPVSFSNINSHYNNCDYILY